MIAYNTGTGANIADVTITNKTGVTQGFLGLDTANPNLTVTAVDLIHITGTDVSNLNPHNIFFT